MRSETISPTAHYTGYVWFAHGQSHEAFATRGGRLMYRALHAPSRVLHRAGLPTLEGMLIARHRLIDLRLAQAIEAGEVSQVIEVAAGLSPRGWRFRKKYGDRITYVEGDLSAMIARKRRVLATLGGETAGHRTAEVDALADHGPHTVEGICEGLEEGRGTAIITEGLINYFDQRHVVAMWTRFARALRRFPRGLYLSDVLLRAGNEGPFARGFGWLLSAFVRGKTYLHFDAAAEAEAALARAGMRGVLLDPRDFAVELPGLETAGASRVRIIEAIAKKA